MLDPDVPIPYSITPAGHRALEEALLEDVVAACRHEWNVGHVGELYCVICGLEKAVKPQEIPSYLGVKRRKD